MESGCLVGGAGFGDEYGRCVGLLEEVRGRSWGWVCPCDDLDQPRSVAVNLVHLVYSRATGCTSAKTFGACGVDVAIDTEERSPDMFRMVSIEAEENRRFKREG